MIAAFLLVFFSFAKTGAQSTNSIIQVLDPSSVTLTTEESAKLTLIQNNPMTLTYWHINVNSLASCVSGTTLATSLPGVSGVKSFTADYVFSLPNGEYYWSGANTSGEQIRLGKVNAGYFGNISLPGLDIYYGIQKLSDTRYVLVKYHEDIFANPNECGTPAVEDEEEDSVVEDRSDCDGNVIRVLFLYTSASLNSGFDPFVVAPAVIDELNATTAASGLTNSDISFSLANVGPLNGFDETTNDIFGDLDRLTDNSDAQDARDYSKADVVILFTRPAYGTIVGVGYQTASNANAYGIAVISFAATSFTASHEIGHIIGARHQRCTVCSVSNCDNATNHHGFPIGTSGFRTIMMQQTCAGARTGRWSNPESTFMGFATGDADNNNVAILKSRADNVACFRGDPATPIYPYYDNWVYLTGPNWVCDGDDEQPYSVSYSSQFFTAPITYSWSVSETGLAPWTLLSCNTNQCTVTDINDLSSPFFVRVTLTDVNGHSGTDIQKVEKVLCRTGKGKNREDTGSITGKVQPNPFADILRIGEVTSGARLSVMDANGRVLEQQVCKETTPEFHWDLRNLVPGIYFLRIEDTQGIENFKIIKQ
ncbi:MAG: zinc-dependent metalloprotease [Saprospiraceae bacterium]|nr:zinc-dependent metalloprotease [Saprospiraceae bacterium]